MWQNQRVKESEVLLLGRRRNQSRSNQMKHLITELNSRSPIAEQYRTIRTNLQFASVDHPLQTILITSSSPAEGKSITAANLAVVYAQQGKRVLLIDADLRKPTVHYTFRLNNIRGLSNILVGESTLEDMVEDSSIDHLDVLTCGPIPPNPSELLGSKRMDSLIEHAKTIYDIIIFDTPPILAVTDAQILANYVDGTLLIIRSGITEYEMAIKAKEALQQTTAKILGTVLNDREKKAANSYYYYGAN